MLSSCKKCTIGQLDVSGCLKGEHNTMKNFITHFKGTSESAPDALN